MRIMICSTLRSILCFSHFTMKSLLILVCLVLSAQCALYYKVQDEIPGHENQCYDEIDNSFYNARETMNSQPGVCSRVTCLGRREDHQVLVQIATCGAVMAMPGCHIIEDLSKPYPECCPRIVSCERPPGNFTE